MINLLIYTGPNKKFSPEDERLARIQIDNSLQLGWNKNDILLVTDFPFQYKGVSSVPIENGLYYEFDKNANKIRVLTYMFKNNLIKPGVIYWCHDFDAYENYKIDESELGLTNFDLGLTHYFYKSEWQFGSTFIKNEARDIIELIDKNIRENPHLSRNEEKTLTKLVSKGLISDKRFKKMNPTYNFMKRCIQTVYQVAEKPIKVLHFRPSDKKDYRVVDSPIRMFMYGKNRLKIPLMSDRLIKIFNQNGIS